MTSELHPTKRILRLISKEPGCLMEEVAAVCPDLTWNQVFLEVDWMTRTGQVRMRQEKPGRYSLWPPTTQESGAAPTSKEKVS